MQATFYTLESGVRLLSMTTIQSEMFGTSPFRDVLQAIEARTDSNWDKGNAFEQLTKAFFEQDALYREQFEKVWMWMDWPGRGGRPDTGIDLVAKNGDDGEFTAIQCKFYGPNSTITKDDVDSFISASGIYVPGAPRFTKRIFVSTTDSWTKNAEEALNQQVPVARLGARDFENSSIDWTQFNVSQPTKMVQRKRKSPFQHQLDAIVKVLDGFQEHDRGKLIMACGTGKTFTALRIAEQQTKPGDIILFLAPSITLVSQSIREWGNEATESMQIHVVCSDTKVGSVGDEDANTAGLYDIVAPATTDENTLFANVSRSHTTNRRTVIFSTYHSLGVIAAAQKLGMGEIALVICDEAHRTTGVTLAGAEESSAFVQIHDNANIKADKRLYMTATPRIYGGQSRTKAQAAQATLTSMDDEKVYGPEFYRFTFADAVEANQLCDYRVLVFGVDESFISRDFQQVLGDSDLDLSLNDAGKIIASLNAMSKKQSQFENFEQDPNPMQSVVAFASRIKESEAFRDSFNQIAHSYDGGTEGGIYLADHVDGRNNMLVRSRKLDWLRDSGDECHVLSNAKCLTEGVDVPALDAVLFLSPRSSQIDVVQAVGRAMRKSDSTGKKFGYIIIPVTVPATENYEKIVLDRKFNPTFQVLQALKSHDEDFYDTINQADLKANKKVTVAIFTGNTDSDGKQSASGDVQSTQPELNVEVSDKVRDAIFARIVDSLTDKHYYTRWAKETARINEQYEERIKGLLKADSNGIRVEFDKFHSALRRELNSGITKDKAISLLAQHLVTKPIFDALFSEFEFAKHNPVSQAMEGMVRTLRFEHGTDSETKELAGFYQSVKRRVQYVDTAEKKQRIIADLYQEFFRTAFPKEAEALGIVYTPVEAVDFVIRSVEDILQEDFGVSVSNEGVNVLDPFTGTGTFITRLLVSGLVKTEDLVRKYTQELHANEITLLAYYIATINVEMTFHDLAQPSEYTPFNGIVFADSFEARENRVAPRLGADFFEANSDRMKYQNERDIRVIIGNPPWSSGQGSANDDNANRVYSGLRQRVSKTYVRASSTQNRNSLYDTYIQAIRMASDRVEDSKNGGVVAFVTNGGFIDGDAAAGLRKCLLKEFHKVYCLNLRGSQRGTAGDTSRREGGKLFGSGSRASVAVLMLVKKSGKIDGQGKLYYHDIGDYLTREHKLAFLDENRKSSVTWREITPDEHGDWINPRDPRFTDLVPLYGANNALFNLNSAGIKTHRDAWVYGFGKRNVIENTRRMMESFNQQIPTHNPDIDPRNFSWSRSSLQRARNGVRLEHDESHVVSGIYRPFTKQNVYFHKSVNEEIYRQERIYATPYVSNIGISISDKDKNKPMSCLMTNVLPDLELVYHGQYVPRWTYEKSLSGDGYEKVSNINPVTLTQFREHYTDNNISEDDLFHYVYGMLHHQDFRTRYAANLSKEATRIPMAASLADFRLFVGVGETLSDLHVNYERVEPYPLKEEITGNPDMLNLYRVAKKMKHPGKRGDLDESALVYNEHITLRGIPEEAHRYVIGQYSALRWLMERYYVKTDSASGIVNDPNDWCDEHGDRRYIIDMVKRVVTVSVKTMEIVDSLPELPK